MYLHQFCTVYKQAKRKQRTLTNNNCFYQSRAYENRFRNKSRSNRSRKPVQIFGVENRSRFCMTHVPKVGSDFRLRESAPVFDPVCLQHKSRFEARWLPRVLPAQCEICLMRHLSAFGTCLFWRRLFAQRSTSAGHDEHTFWRLESQSRVLYFRPSRTIKSFYSATKCVTVHVRVIKV